MKGRVQLEEHHGRGVMTHLLMDELRRTECLCLNCLYGKDACETAKELYQICKDRNLALAVTRCPECFPRPVPTPRPAPGAQAPGAGK